MLIVGEVHTGLLRNRGELSDAQCREALCLVSGEQVRTSLRPLPHAISPEVLAGVDCRLPSLSGARIRATGTVTHRAAITGGRILQGSSYAVIVRAERDYRMPWSHYLARPGQVEVQGRPRWRDMADGFMASELALDILDFGAISGRLMNRVQDSPRLDRKTPFKTTRTRLRWVMERGKAEEEEGLPPVRLTLWNGMLRTLRLTGEPDTRIVAFCEDLALHDWLLTTLQTLIERALIGTAAPTQIAAKLSPAIDHLLHLWMPGARMDDSFQPLWEELERHPGFSRQWKSSVERIRDQVAVNTLSLLSVMAESRREADGDPISSRVTPPDGT
ncbi:SCO2521 family protein [Sphaerisporangium sp. NPDC049002]|uniref:SCO2521 family protein n=1 Tax=unclassified Sphaerisporangium TaxID=2630420 RepID=UPI003405AC77